MPITRPSLRLAWHHGRRPACLNRRRPRLLLSEGLLSGGGACQICCAFDNPAALSVVRRQVRFPKVTKVRPQFGGRTLEWAGHTRAWTLETGSKVWLRTSAKRQAFPPKGIELPIVLGDETVIRSTVVSSSPTRIVIELDSGHLRCLTPGMSGLPPRGFPGSEWIVQLRV